MFRAISRTARTVQSTLRAGNVTRVLLGASCDRQIATAAPGETRVGFCGTGVMGAPMAGHILDAGYEMSVYNRTAHKAQGLVDAGAQLCASPGDVAASSDVVIAIVGYPADVREVFLDEHTGLIPNASPDTIFVDMTTSEPSLALELDDAAQSVGCRVLDAPVSGGDIGARAARLSIMAGGDKAAYKAVLPILRCMGTNINHMGPVGSGQHTKLVNQVLISSLMVGLCEGMLYAHAAGLNVENVLDAVSSGAAGSWSLDNYAPRILKGDYDPGFMVDHFVKDLGIALQEARRMQISLPGLALAQQLYISLQAQGGGDRGTHALYLALEHINSCPAHSSAASVAPHSSGP